MSFRTSASYYENISEYLSPTDNKYYIKNTSVIYRKLRMSLWLKYRRNRSMERENRFEFVDLNQKVYGQ